VNKFNVKALDQIGKRDVMMETDRSVHGLLCNHQLNSATPRFKLLACILWYLEKILNSVYHRLDSSRRCFLGIVNRNGVWWSLGTKAAVAVLAADWVRRVVAGTFQHLLAGGNTATHHIKELARRHHQAA
jgi:hypothetical protein